MVTEPQADGSAVSRVAYIAYRMGAEPVLSLMMTCLEEYKMKYPDSLVNTDEFSRKCSERCKTSFAKEKVNLDDMANCYDREKNYVPLRVQIYPSHAMYDFLIITIIQIHLLLR
ncbi:hypothetical protein U0070_004462 [Myodes glareolus]|uniref:Uncharacterized protein n=1 Tax=Myodes glareolus TaxID=447135 RepID=A0AAW0H5E2_MYOGA